MYAIQSLLDFIGRICVIEMIINIEIFGEWLHINWVFIYDILYLIYYMILYDILYLIYYRRNHITNEELWVVSGYFLGVMSECVG